MNQLKQNEDVVVILRDVCSPPQRFFENHKVYRVCINAIELIRETERSPMILLTRQPRPHYQTNNRDNFRLARVGAAVADHFYTSHNMVSIQIV